MAQGDAGRGRVEADPGPNPFAAFDPFGGQGPATAPAAAPSPSFETTGRVWIGGRKASGPFVKLRASADDLSITTPIVSVSYSPREVVAFQPKKALFGYGGFEIVQTRDGRSVQFWCRDADRVREQIAATGFVPRGRIGGGPDPTRAARRAEEDRIDAGRKWKIAVIIATAVLAILAVLFFGITYGMRHGDVYVASWATVQADPRVVAVVGQPMTSGFPTGSVEVTASDGHADLHYDVTGPRGKGSVDVVGTKADGQWRIERHVFEPDGRPDRSIDLIGSR